MKVTNNINLESILTKNQKKTFTRFYHKQGEYFKITLTIRYDDECDNGHNTFAMTADIYEKAKNGRWIWVSGGCQHEEIAKRFPKYAKYIKWHLCNSDGPMYYIKNTLYLAGDKDCHGHRKDEPCQWDYIVRFGNSPIRIEIREKFYNFLKDNVGKKAFEVVSFVHDREPDTYSPNYTIKGFGEAWHECPFREEYKALDFCKALNTCKVHFDKVPSGFSKGKEREFDAARSTAIWPEATDEQLASDNLKDLLLERLPALMAEFQKDIIELGFVY